MIPDIGQFALFLALLAAAVQATVPIVGAARGDAAMMRIGTTAGRTQAFLVALAFGCLVYSFVTGDFSVLNVAMNSNSQLPLVYRVAAVWGSHEGSLLLWTLTLALWTTAVTVFSKALPAPMRARVLGVMGAISAGFLLFMLLTSSPFTRLHPVPLDGRDLNPTLQDPAMAAHPPMLYMGYVGFSVAFAFAVAAMIGGKLDSAWARWSRPWTTIAWTFLTSGIALGSYWAYYELGWGGWWFWDPVENASFMPWLVGTALIHSLAVTEKRGSFTSWTALLAIAAFSLSLLGTFLVRSGVLTSVHAFASDPKRGVFILCFLGAVVGGSLALYAWRMKHAVTGETFDLVSRESLLLTNNVLLTTAAATVLLGTMYPLAMDVLGLGKISVGPPYFNAVFVAVMAPAFFLLGVGPIARWKKASLPELTRRLRWAFVASAIAALGFPLVTGRWKPLVSLGLLLAFWIAATVTVSIRDRLRVQAPGRNLRTRLRSLPLAYYGMLFAHFGVAVSIAGVTLVTGYEAERELRMETGDAVHVGGYDFSFNGTRELSGPNYRAIRADIEVRRGGKPQILMHPEKRFYPASENLLSEAAIHAGLFRDLYVSLGAPADGEAWGLRIQYKPFVDWIWGGALFMVLGGVLAVASVPLGATHDRAKSAGNPKVRRHRPRLKGHQ